MRMMHTMAPQPGSERTTVTLPAALTRRLRTEARAHDRSVSSLIREALEAYLAGQPAPELPSFAGVGDSGITDLSERVEELLAEAIRRRSES
jgi:plasmid stability protein